MKASWLLLVLSVGVVSAEVVAAEFGAFPGRSFYTNEARGSVVVTGLQISTGTEIAYRVVLAAAGMSWSSTLQPAGRVYEAEVPLGELPLGVSRLTCELFRGDVSLGSRPVVFRRLAPTSNAVSVDRVSGCLIADGLPVIPVGFYCYSPVQPRLAEEEVVRGFNLMSPYQSNRAGTRDRRRAYMDRCAELGMRVHYQLLSVAGGGGVYGARGSDNQEEALRDEVRAFRDHPALLAWYISDEPTGHGAAPERLARIRSIIREEDPYHPVTIVFMRPKRALDYAEGLDVVMVDPYPIPVRPPASAGRAVSQVVAELFPAKTVWMVPQCFGGNEHWRREPTGREVRVMSYLGLLEGARGFQYFIRHGLQGFPKSPVLWSECSRFALETEQLTPYLASHEPVPEVRSDIAAVRVSAWRDRGSVAVLAVNTENTPCSVRLSLPDVVVDGDAALPFEHRSVECSALFEEVPRQGLLSTLAFWRSRPEPRRSGTVIDDMLDAYAVRIYELREAGVDEGLPEVGLHPADLLWNGSFEQNTSAGVPAGCYAKVGDGRGPTYRVDARVAAAGRRSLRLHTPRAGEGVGIEPFRPRVKSGQAYLFSLMAKSASPDGGKLLIKAGRASTVVALTPAWQTYSISCVAPEARNSKLYLMYRLESAGTAWVDALQCIHLAPTCHGSRAEDGSWAVALKNVPEGATIRYTLDGSDPGSGDRVYHAPIPIPRSLELGLRLRMRDVVAPTFSVPIRRHAANGCVPVFEHSFSSRYSGGGEGALTDSFLGSVDDLHTAWQGFLRDDLVATVDLGEPVPLRDMRARFLQHVRSWIWLPQRLTVSASADGRTFRDVGRVGHDVPLDAKQAAAHTFVVRGDGRAARFVRFQAEAIGVCPAWHAGAGKDSWLFVDEIEVNPIE